MEGRGGECLLCDLEKSSANKLNGIKREEKTENKENEKRKDKGEW